MPLRQGEGHNRAPGVANNHRAVNAELVQSNGQWGMPSPALP
jgi:hypothetical protein